MDQSPAAGIADAAPRRPPAVTVVSWFYVIGAVGTFIYLAIPGALAKVQSYAGALGYSPYRALITATVPMSVYAIASVAMLNGRNWGRWVLLVSNAVVTLTGIVSGPKLWTVTALGVGFYVALVVILTRPAVTLYFSPADATTRLLPARPETASLPVGSPGGLRRILAVVALYLGGVSFYVWLIMIWSLRSSLGSILFVSCIIGPPAALFLIVGLWAWGWPTWLRTLGTVLISVGGLALFMASFLWETSLRGYFDRFVPNVNPENIQVMYTGSLVAGIASAVLGGVTFLLWRSRHGAGDRPSPRLPA